MNPAGTIAIGIRVRINKRAFRACFPEDFVASWTLANWITAELKRAGETDAFCALTSPLASAIGTVHGLQERDRSLEIVRGVLDTCGLGKNLAQLCYFDPAEEIWRAHGAGDQVAFRNELNTDTLPSIHQLMIAQAEHFLARLKLADQMPD